MINDVVSAFGRQLLVAVGGATFRHDDYLRLSRIDAGIIVKDPIVVNVPKVSHIGPHTSWVT